MKKDVVYIESDDEISVVADKVASSKSKVVALVLPKRCTMLHSAVNMKILNKAASNSSKNIVLITSEKALLPIAGASGLYVAKSLQSKPAIPVVEAAIDADVEETAQLEDPEIDPTVPIGVLAGEDPDDTTITIDNTEPEVAKEEDKKADKKEKKDKKLKVPNFDTFRKKLFLGIGIVIVLIIVGYVMAVVLPRAMITVVTKQQEIPLSIEITASPKLTDNIETKEFKLETKAVDKADSKKAPATGKLDKGTKASGTVQLSIPCSAVTSYPVTIPSGTGVSTGSLTFITQDSVSLTGLPGGGACKFSGSVDVTAQNAGGEYNVSSGRTFTVAGYSAVTGTNKEGFDGGTSNVVTVVQDSDCEALQSSMAAASNSDEVKKQLIAEFEQAGIAANSDSYKVETVSSSCDPAVGQEATEVTAKATFRYSLSGVNANSLSQLITQEALEQAGQGQTIVDTGLSTASITTVSQSSTVTTMLVKTTAITGVKQSEEEVKALVAGKNARETSDTLKAFSGVEDVKIEYSPFWVNKTPTNPEHITVIFEQANGN